MAGAKGMCQHKVGDTTETGKQGELRACYAKIKSPNGVNRQSEAQTTSPVSLSQPLSKASARNVLYLWTSLKEQTQI